MWKRHRDKNQAYKDKDHLSEFRADRDYNSCCAIEFIITPKDEMAILDTSIQDNRGQVFGHKENDLKSNREKRLEALRLYHDNQATSYRREKIPTHLYINTHSLIDGSNLTLVRTPSPRGYVKSVTTEDQQTLIRLSRAAF